MGTKYGVIPANAVGVVDSDYRGEVCVCLHNHSDKPYVVQPQDRIAQLLVMPVAVSYTHLKHLFVQSVRSPQQLRQLSQLTEELVESCELLILPLAELLRGANRLDKKVLEKIAVSLPRVVFGDDLLQLVPKLEECLRPVSYTHLYPPG